MFVIFGVGIYYEANLFPDNQRFWTGDWTEWRIWDVLYYPYWQIYAELNLEYLNGTYKCLQKCPLSMILIMPLPYTSVD